MISGTLHLLTPDHREAATLSPIFDYDVQFLHQIRSALLAAYGQKYGPPDRVAKEEILIAGRAVTFPVRTLLHQPQSRAPRGAILHMHGGGWIAAMCSPTVVAGMAPVIQGMINRATAGDPVFGQVADRQNTPTGSCHRPGRG